MTLRTLVESDRLSESIRSDGLLVSLVGMAARGRGVAWGLVSLFGRVARVAWAPDSASEASEATRRVSGMGYDVSD